MARYKNDPANEGYDAGDAFDYSVWTANTELTLCNVPWDAVYKDVWAPESTQKLNEYIDSRGDVSSITNAMYARIDEPISIDMPLGRASRYNYIRVLNPAQPVGNDTPKYYFYFIRGFRHVSPSTTEITVQLDVWQTYIRQVQFGRAYVDRGHIGIANEANFRNYGRDFLTVQEGLDTGSDYMNVAIKRHKIMSARTANEINAGNGISVLAISTIDLHGDLGTRADPKNPSAKPSGIQGLPSGAAAYIWATAGEFMAFMNDFSDKPWATAGITSITIIPDVRRYMQDAHISNLNLGAKNPKTRSYSASSFFPWYQRRAMFPNWRESPDILNYIPARFRHLKKLLTSPYCQIEMTANAGSTIVLKPESWNADDAPIMDMISILPPNQRAAFIPAGYNDRNKIEDGARQYGNAPRSTFPEIQGDGLDMALFLSGFPTVPIVNNGQIQYLASNARSIATQYQGANWAHQKNMAGNQLSFDQASVGIGAGQALANNAIGSDQAQTQIQQELAAQQALMGLVGGTAAGAGMGAFAGPVGAIAGGVGGAVSGGMGMLSTGMQADAANRSLAERMSSAGTVRDIQAGSSTFMRDSNKGMADWAAKGDYAVQRAQMDAKIQDTAMIPHGTSGQFGGEAFNLANDLVDLTLKFKMIDQAAMSVVGEYWLRYGYPVRRSTMIPNDLRVMDKFSYWKLSEIYIRSAGMPESFKQAIRGILEKGVTVWNDPDDIGVIDFADNRPLPGITLEGYIPPDWEPEPDPEPPTVTNRKRKKMLVLATNDNGMKYALAGTSPGTEANFILTESESLKDEFLKACGVDSPTLVDTSLFYELQAKYLSPVLTFATTEGV